VKLDAAYVKPIADTTGFDAVQLEKVIRLRQLLIEFRKHPFLQERLVLSPSYSCCLVSGREQIVFASNRQGHYDLYQSWPAVRRMTRFS
jgi:hypothetical protein